MYKGGLALTTNYSAWWLEEKPKKPLPASLQKLLRENDPRFIRELEKFAYRFSSYVKEDESGKKYWVRFESELRQKDASWLWTLYLEPSELAREGLKRILQYKSVDELKSLSIEVDQDEHWKGDYASYYPHTSQISRMNCVKYSLTKNSIRFYPFLKGIYKSAEQKRDAEIWGILAYRFDVDSAYQLQLDGIYPSWKRRNDTFINVYSSHTHYYIQRRSWRTLKKLGQKKSDDYVKFATQLLLQYQKEDLISAEYKEEQTAPYLTLMRVLFHNSKRIAFTGSSTYLKRGYLEHTEREEAFPELWDQHPELLIQILEHTEVPVIADFAAKALEQGQAEWILTLDDDLLYRLLHSPVAQTQLFAAKTLLKKREQEQRVDLELLMRFSIHPQPKIREVTFTYLQQLVDQREEKLSFFVNNFIDYIEQNPDLDDEVVADWNRFFRESGEELLAQVASWKLFKSLSESKREVLQDLSVLVLPYLDPAKERFDAKELLPYLQSEHRSLKEAVRSFLLRDFTKLPLDVEFLVAFSTIPGEDHQVFATQFFTDRQLWALSFGKGLIQSLWTKMLQRDLDEEVRTFVREVLLGTLFFSELADTDLEKVLRLMESDEIELQEFGARLLQLIDPTPEQFTDAQLLELAHSKLLIARQVARELIEQKMGELDEDFLVNLVETDWDDTREWVFSYLQSLAAEQFTPRLVYGLLDTAREDIQKEAMALVARHEEKLDLKELAQRASESTDLIVQEYACELLQKIEWDLKTLQKLERFFRTVLFRVHAGRKAKKILLPQLLELAEQKEEYAAFIVPILSDLLAIQERHDFEQILFSLAKIQKCYPQLQTPIKLR